VDTQDDPTPPGADGTRAPWLAVRTAVAEAGADPSLSGLAASLQRICRAASSSLGLAGAAVHFVTHEREAVVASSDEVSRQVGELSFEVGEGPCLDAFILSRPVLVPDLLTMGGSRWPGFMSALDGHGVRAAYSFPLHIGAVRLGVLDLYGASVRSLTPEELTLALAFATAATEVLLARPAGSSVALLDEAGLGAMERRIEIHQAQGMVTVDLGVELLEALALMRAHAFSREIPLLELAQLIVGGERLSRPRDG
jgi:hypothetical protein